MMPASAQRFSPPRLATVNASSPGEHFSRRHDFDAGIIGRRSILQQAESGAVILGDDFRLMLIAVGHRDDHAFRAEQQVVDGQDEAVGADQGAGAAAVGAEADRGRDVRRRDLRMHADGRAHNFLEQ